MAVLLSVSPAAAQETGTEERPGTSSSEIVVTAQRRAQSVQDVPLAVTALEGETLAQEGVRGVEDLGEVAPSLSITTSGATQIFMRGVGSTNVTPVGDSAVAVHLDGVYLARSNALNAQFYDIARVEVVRGPQGTLYGRNATAGAINIITNQPRFDFEGAAAVEYGNYNTLVMSGMVNAPVTDTLALRAAFQSIRHDGYLEAADGPVNAQGNDRNDQNDISGRAQLLFQPGDRFKITLRGDYTHQGGAGPAAVPYPNPTGDPYVAVALLDVYQDNAIFGGSLEAEYDLGFATVTYLGGYRELQLDSKSEILQTGNNRPIFVDNNQKSWSHELRLAGETGPLEWVVGAYRFEEENFTDFRIQLPPGIFLTFMQGPIAAESIAFFGQATYSLTDAVRITGGLRYTEDEKSRIGGTFLTGADGTVLRQIAVNNADATWDSIDWKVGAEYDLSPDSLLYAQAATAYKAGGYFDGPAPNTYDPEEIMSYEIGSKNVLADGRLRLNVAAFYNDYSDLQVSAVEVIAGEAALVTRNAGTAEIYGVELETAFQLTPNASFDFVGSWLHAEYTDFVLPFGDPFVNNDANADIERCYAADYSQPRPRRGDFSGCALARTPEFAFSAGYSHRFDLGNGGAIIARAQTRYESEKNLEFHGFAANREGDFTKTDLALTYQSPDDWYLQAYVRNIENDAVRTNSNPNAQTGITTNGTDVYAPPRLYGIRLSANF